MFPGVGALANKKQIKNSEDFSQEASGNHVQNYLCASGMEDLASSV